CRNIEGNGDACVRLSTPCTPDEDACISHVHYTTPTSYWTPLAERKHYISKGCVSYSACIKQRDITQRSCTYDWFTDWSCVECCGVTSATTMSRSLANRSGPPSAEWRC
ncbi:hypothetical protein BOX15_Mlig018876g2, partial [Macrostomum lignano]